MGLDRKVLHEALGPAVVVGIAAPVQGTDEAMFSEYETIRLEQLYHFSLVIGAPTASAVAPSSFSATRATG